MRIEKSPYPIFKVYSNQIRILTRFEKSLYSISKYQQQSKDPNQGFTALKAIHRNHEFYPSGLLTHFFSFTKHIQVLVCITIIHIHTINQQQWSRLQIIHTCLDCKTNPGTCCWIIHNQSIKWVSALGTRKQCLTKIHPLDYTIPKMFFLCVVYPTATINPEPLKILERAFTPQSARSQKVEIFESIWNTEIRS
jgi:hypothetical protein